MKTKRVDFDNEVDPINALESAREEVFAFLHQSLEDGPSKFYILMKVVFEKDLGNGEVDTIEVVLPEDDGCSIHTLLRESQMEQFYRISGQDIEGAINRHFGQIL